MRKRHKDGSRIGKMTMKVFMLGWEFPPHISGGLGTACQGLTKALNEAGVEIVFVLPTGVPCGQAGHVLMRTPASLGQRCGPGTTRQASLSDLPGQARTEMHRVAAVLQPYATPQGLQTLSSKSSGETCREGRCGEVAQLPRGSFGQGRTGQYQGDLLVQVNKYAAMAVDLAESEAFDVVHAHDWMTFPAGLAVAGRTGKPLVVHVHSTEFDRSGEHVNQQVYDIERAGMQGAHRVLCVSHFTRRIVVDRYGVSPDKAEVAHNGVDAPDAEVLNFTPIKRREKLVVFLGRITMQKGPEHFLRAAKRVLEKVQDVRFVIAGNGDLFGRVVELAAALGIGRHVTFTGFLNGRDVSRLLRMADLYVMPSVSEPFGIAPLEALAHDVPVIVSKQSGVSEVLRHALKVDFWDIDEMANKMVAVLKRPALHQTLRENGGIEVRTLTWANAARKCLDVYGGLVGRRQQLSPDASYCQETLAMAGSC